VDVVVGISEYAVSSDPDDTLITYSLGSCVGLVLHDPVAGIGGLLHAMMPVSTADPGKAAMTPAMYVDTGAAHMLQEMFDRGATRPNLSAWVVGAANQLDSDNLFRIGARNHAIVRKVLWKNGILIADEETGGSISRTVTLEVGDGRAFVKSSGGVRELRPPRTR
jgi:chemotaxis protein CheD